MADTNDTVTITARMVDELSAPLVRIGTELKALGASIKGLDVAGVAAAAGGMTQVSKAMKDMDALGKRVGSTMSDFADAIGAKLEQAARRGADALALMGVAAVGWGLKTTASMQQSRLALDTFLGSAVAGGQAFIALQKLVGPATFGQLTQGFQALSLAGASPQFDISMMQALSNISAVQQQPGQAFDALAQAVNRIQETGQLEARSMLAFISNGVDIYGMLSKELGVPRDAVKKTLAGGANITAPAGFLQDLLASGQAGGKFGSGLADWRKTLGGQFDQIKTDLGIALAGAVTPLTSALDKVTPKIDAWVTATGDRFKSLGPLLSQQWGSGDMSGFSDTLAKIFGDPSLAPVIDSTATAVQSLGRILVNDVIPIGKDLLHVAVPALQALGDVLGFLGQHQALTESLLVTFGGFLVLVKVSAAVKGMSEAFTVWKLAVGDGGWMLAALNFMRGMLGLNAVGGAALGTESAAAGMSAAYGLGGGAAVGGAAIGAGAAAAAGLVALALVAQGDSARGAYGMPKASDLAAGSAYEKWLATSGRKYQGMTQSQAYQMFRDSPAGRPITLTVTNHINGAGNPQAVANQVGKSVVDALEQAQLQAAQRGGPLVPGLPGQG